MSPEFERAARLYRRVDHRDPHAVRRAAARRIKVARLAGWWAAADPRVRVEDTRVPGGQEGSAVPVRVYWPVRATGGCPAVLYLHGGAFLAGDLDFEHPRCLELCGETGLVVVSVDYRLAPEFPYPAGLDDCMRVYEWLAAGGLSPDVDPARIAVAGASAGGALAAALCLKARDLGRPPPRRQLLLYPVLDDRQETPSMRGRADTPVWDAANCAHMWNHYLGPPGTRGEVPVYAAPARAGDLSGLPPAYVMTAEHDPLRDEGAEYARRLGEAGVRTRYRPFAGTFHGFDTLVAAPLSDAARAEQHEFLRQAMG